MTLDRSLFVEALGWAATATFVGSYFFARPQALVRVQMVGGAMWVLYGFLVGAAPVVAANVLVMAAAAWKAWRAPGAPLTPSLASRRPTTSTGSAPQPEGARRSATRR